MQASGLQAAIAGLLNWIRGVAAGHGLPVTVHVPHKGAVFTFSAQGMRCRGQVIGFEPSMTVVHLRLMLPEEGTAATFEHVPILADALAKSFLRGDGHESVPAVAWVRIAEWRALHARDEAGAFLAPLHRVVDLCLKTVGLESISQLDSRNFLGAFPVRGPEDVFNTVRVIEDTEGAVSDPQ